VNIYFYFNNFFLLIQILHILILSSSLLLYIFSTGVRFRLPGHQICSVGRGLVRIFSSMQAEEGKISRLYPVIVSGESLPICYLGLQNRQKNFYCFWQCCGKSVINLSPESGSIDSEIRIRLKDLKKFKKKVNYFIFEFLLSLTTCMLFN
jgi:hypothetical protein